MGLRWPDRPQEGSYSEGNAVGKEECVSDGSSCENLSAGLRRGAEEQQGSYSEESGTMREEGAMTARNGTHWGRPAHIKDIISLLRASL